MAEEYDRFRPGYPPELIDDLVRPHPTTLLDIGCGTGTAARLLSKRGLDVTGVEPDDAMAGVARRYGLEVEVARFEDWDARGRRFDLVTCAQAWQWLDPRIAVPKVSTVLNPGGVLARFWNYHVFEPAVVEALDAVYDEFAPEAERFGHDPSVTPEPPDPLRRNPDLRILPSQTYRWDESLPIETWVRRIGTFTSHRRLGEERLTALQDEVRRTLNRLGGRLLVHYGTLCLLAGRR